MNNKIFFYFFKINQDRIEGFVIMILLIILIIGIGIWYQLIVKPKEKQEFNKWLIDKKDVLELNIEIKNILRQLSIQQTSCTKCKHASFQLWEINSFLIIRCTNCNRKQEHSIKTIFEIKTIFDLHITLFKECLSTQNSVIKNYLKNYLEWDFESVRKGNSFYSVFKIIALKEEENSNPKINSHKKTRIISNKVKNQVWNRDNGKCIECGSNENLEFDHIIPFSKGGSNTYRNIQLLCQSCNRMKSDKIG